MMTDRGVQSINQSINLSSNDYLVACKKKASEHMIDKAKLRTFYVTAELARNRESCPRQYFYENKPACKRL